MLIFGLLYLFGFALPFICLFHLIRGIRTRNVKRCILAVLVPVLYWSAVTLLYYADQRFIREETRKNGGQLPDWVW